MRDAFLDKIKVLAEQVAVRESCFLYDLEFAGSTQARVLRVFIDRDTENGVSIEDCSNVSKGLNLLLDVEDAIPGGRYVLEVSSPGLERVLKEKWHFEKVIGKLIYLKTFEALLEFNSALPQLGKAKQIKGTLLSLKDGGILLSTDLAGKPEEIYVPYTGLTKAHVVFVYGKAQQD